MATTIARRLLPLVTLITIVAAGRCKVPVPFDSKLVGRLFARTDNCVRPNGYYEVQVNATSITFRPFFFVRFTLPRCDEKYIFRFGKDRKHPFVLRYPPLDVPPKFESSDREIKRYCEKKQPKLKEKYFPVGKTRKMFKESIRAIVNGAIEIRDFGCTEDDQGLFIEVPGRAFKNVDLDGIVTYLLGVAYQYNFCAEPA